MRNLTFFAVFLCSFVAGCAADPSQPGSSEDAEIVDAQALATPSSNLTDTQAKDALALLNDHCGDSWCEGDLDLNFTKLSCDFGNKTCTFTVFVTDPGASDATSDDRTFWRSCKMSKVGTTFDSLVVTAANGFKDLTDAFYAKVDDCVTKVEDSIPPAPAAKK